MAKRGKRWLEARKALPRGPVPVEEAIEAILQAPAAKFDESVDVAVRLGVDPRHADQMVRGVIALPHGTGKEVRVAAFAKGPKAEEAKEAGADIVGAEDLAERIQEGFLEFDRVVATPDMMPIVGRLGRILGPRGLMPNPKVGTVTTEIGKAIRAIKAGQIEVRVDKGGNIHAPIGRRSFSAEQLKENFEALMTELVRLKPAAAKGRYILGVAISTTMGPSVRVDASRW